MPFPFKKLSYSFDNQLLIKDLQTCQQQAWKLHFHQEDYSGNWSSFALRSISGSEFDILATPNATFQDTPTLALCPYFRQIIDSFQCTKEAVRLLSLAPNSYIKEHRDNAAGYENGFFRIHIPIQTNAQVIFRVNGQVLPMQVGECWYADFNLPHFVSNDGETDRIHLVIDCLRNDWSDQLFASIGYDFEEEYNQKHSRETKLLMIQHLSLMEGDGAKILVEKLRAEVGN